MNKNVKKLVLNRETIRTLQDSELRLVVGGGGVEPEQARALKRPVITGSPCYCGSTMTNDGAAVLPDF